MNRTALSVIGLAVGAVLIIGLFNIYKPAVSHVAHDVFSKVHVNHLGLKEHKYKNLYYTDDHHGNIEFTRGTLKNTSWGPTNNFAVGPDVPKDIANAKSIKFDNVDASHVTSLNSMFWYDSHVKNIDFGDNFDTSNVANGTGQNSDYHTSYPWGMASMFQSDPNLEHVNFGSKFKVNSNVSNWALCNMFYGDHKLQKPTGNVNPHVQKVYEMNMTQGGYPGPAGY